MPHSSWRPTRRRIVQGLGAALLPTAWPSPSRAAAADPSILEARPAELRLGGDSGPLVQASTFGGRVPGPLIRAKAGQPVDVRLVNRLDRPTSLHWHGVRIANVVDGAAGLTAPAIAPGGSADIRFVPPDAGTFWYHCDVPAEARRQTEAGLYGVLVVDADHDDPVDRELVLVIDDWAIGNEPARLTVNGKAVEDIVLRTHERLLLRLVNAMTTRIASLAFGGIEPLIVALDGRPTNEAFAPAGHRLDLAPGGRADLVVDGPKAVDGGAGIAMRDEDGIVEIVRLSTPPGDALRANPLPQPQAAAAALPAEIELGKARRADLVMTEDWPVTARDESAARPLLAVARGTPVTLALANRAEAARVVHVHGHAMRLLHPLDDGWEPFWLDTVIVAGGETVHVAFLADNPGRWRIACQTIGQDGAMNAWFQVD